MSADPSWLDEAAEIIACHYEDEPGSREAMNFARETLRAVLAFAARQPRPITDAMVLAAAQRVWAILDRAIVGNALSTAKIAHEISRAALEAAEKAREA